jgi:release factor glutamine methyltransferase
MTTRLRPLIDAAEVVLAQAGVGSPRVDAELLAAYAAGTDRGRLAFAQPGLGFRERYDGLVAQRANRVPLQHLTGTAAFGSIDVQVGPGVFIPRPETESLLEWAIAQRLPSRPVIVDLCTGSGALALALAKEWPQGRVIAVDDSEDALVYARRNVAGSPVKVLQADVTAPGVLAECSGRVDLIVANPPYIPDGAGLEPEVADYDPAHALYGGADGMAVIHGIVELAAGLLRTGGRCAIEHDDTTSGRTVEAFTRTGRFAEVTPRSDLAGRPRFVTATRNGERLGPSRPEGQRQ